MSRSAKPWRWPYERSGLSRTLGSDQELSLARQGEAVIVKNMSFKFRKGEFVTIIGHSGCGKSTILMMVAGLSTVTSGGIVLAGKELNGPGPDRGVVFQSPSLLPWMTRLRKRHARGGSGIPHGRSVTSGDFIGEYYLTLVGLGDSMHKLPVRAFPRHAPAGGNRACLCPCSENAVARRAISECSIPSRDMNFRKF